MKKAIFLSIFVLVLVLGTFLIKNIKPAVRQQSAPSSKIILTYSFTKANQMPVIVAVQKGLFKKYNLDVELQEVSKNVTSVLVTGKADIMLGTPNIALPAAVEGTELSWIGSVSNDQGTVLVSTKDAKNIKTAGVISGPAKVQTIGLLQLLGVNTENITFQEVSDNQSRLLAIKEKQVDTIHCPKADWLIFKRKANLTDEYKILLDSSLDPKIQMPIGIIVRSEFLKKNPESVTNFAKSLIEADNWIKDNKEDFTRLAEEHFADVPKEDIQIEAETYIQGLSSLQFSPTLEKGQDMLKLVVGANPKAKDYNLSNFISTDVSDSLKKSGFLN